MDGKTSLAFFEQYPSHHLLKGTTVKELREFLLKPSNFACSIKKAEKIFSMIKEDGDTTRDYQAERDFIIQSHIRRIRNCKEEMKAIEQHLKLLMQGTGYQTESWMLVFIFR
ncbi:hypothetical protein MH117_01990 [Paenibacillus sp. ACRRX]|uniref:hypothetical protein n=1 Tax=Paenibacillus sp. ACRRX TaxID=2918206 RepID=UPI001EF47906|nr:hypothetical protein [Paenibacillus sp. ACRRX]MCG7406169.1 hypothetical protein [Paenibacillus sp. ACRRX]